MPRRAAAQPFRTRGTGAVRIDDVRPRVQCGDEAVKRCVGDTVEVTATVLAEGQKVVRAAVRYRARGSKPWQREPMVQVPDVPDRFAAEFRVDDVGEWEF